MDLLILQVPIFGLTLWLGLYLIGRDPKNTRLALAGLGLVAYAVGLALEILSDFAPSPELGAILARLRWPLFFFPALFWAGALLYVLPENMAGRGRLLRGWRYGLLPVGALAYLLALATDLLVKISDNKPQAGPLYPLFVAVIFLPLLADLVLFWRELRPVSFSAALKKAQGVLIVCILSFGIGTGLMLFPLDWLPRPWALGALGFDLVLLGLAIAVFDAFDQGEAFLPHFTRSFDFSLLTALLFGGQVALVMIFGTGPNFAMLVLLLAVIGSAIAIQTFSSQFGKWLDNLAFASFPKLRQAQTELRVVSDTLPRVNPSPDLEGMDEAEFNRLTRRALSHFGDLTRLATSPLTHLPQIDTRLQERGIKTDDTLERAAELKTLLAESIARLKPRGKGDFGTSDEWRYYNALYFPYVMGLKPYSLRAANEQTDSAARQALEWFRTTVPERTLYNWQTAAARLVAQNLRQREDVRVASR